MVGSLHLSITDNLIPLPVVLKAIVEVEALLVKLHAFKRSLMMKLWRSITAKQCLIALLVGTKDVAVPFVHIAALFHTTLPQIDQFFGV